MGSSGMGLVRLYKYDGHKDFTQEEAPAMLEKGWKDNPTEGATALKPGRPAKEPVESEGDSVESAQ